MASSRHATKRYDNNNNEARKKKKIKNKMSQHDRKRNFADKKAGRRK